MSKRRRRWFVVLGLGCAVLAAGLVSHWVWAPRRAEPERGEIPAAWFTAPPEATPPEADTTGEAPVPDEEPTQPVRDVVPVGCVQVGRLAYELDGRCVAEETYHLERLSSGDLSLVSEGTFSVRVLLVNVSVAFDQEILLDDEFRPRSYRLDTRGLLGLGSQRITVTVDGSWAVATLGDEKQEIEMPDGDAFFLGTLAAYVVLPSLHASWAEGETLLLRAVGGGAGPGGRSAAGGSVEVVRDGTAELAVGGRAVVLERYRVRAGGFAGTLLARGLEFVAFLGEGERAFTAFRSDLFPRGVPGAR